MGRIEEIADVYAKHIETDWQVSAPGARRVIMVVYDKEAERTMRARKLAFETSSRRAGKDWHEVDLTDAFATWLASDEYKEAYFETPEDLHIKLDREFPLFVAARIRAVLASPGVGETSVVGVFGVASLYGLTRMSDVLAHVEREIPGRLVVFYPGEYEQNNYYLLDARRDGWNYMAVPVTLHGMEGHA